MILALTANGPGEFAGWVRPLLAALYDARSGARRARLLRPRRLRQRLRSGVRARALPAGDRLYAGRVPALRAGPRSRRIAARVPIGVQYLGRRPHARCAAARSSRRGRDRLQVFAPEICASVSSACSPSTRRTSSSCAAGACRPSASRSSATWSSTARSMRRPERSAARPIPTAARDGVIFFPGSRKHEIEQIFPMFVRTALQLRRRLPDVPIAFARSPFTSDAELRAVLARGGIRVAYGVPSVLAADGASLEAGGERFALVKAAHARRAAGPARGVAARNESDRTGGARRARDRGPAVKRAGTRRDQRTAAIPRPRTADRHSASNARRPLP